MSDDSKKMIAAEIEKDVNEILDLPKKIKSKSWLPMMKTKKEWANNLVAEILQPSYSYLSHGFGWSNPQSPINTWKYKGRYLLEGEKNMSPLSISINGKTEQVYLWIDRVGNKY